MVKKTKKLEKIRKNSKNVSLHEFETLIKEYGHIEEGGKHSKAIISIFTLPYKRENPIKSCYVKELLETIDSI
jgi:hypothetical protein